MFVTNQYLRVKNLKFNLTLKSKDESLYEFQEKSRKNEILEKMNELVHFLKNEETKTEESSTLSFSYHTTQAESFERTYAMVEWSSENSTSNEGTCYLINGEEDEVS